MDPRRGGLWDRSNNAECQQLRLVASQILEDPIEYCCHRLDLVARQLVEEIASYRRHVCRCRLLDGSPAGVRQPHHQTSTVIRTFLADNKAARLHAAQVMREATAVPTDVACEFARP